MGAGEPFASPRVERKKGAKKVSIYSNQELSIWRSKSPAALGPMGEGGTKKRGGGGGGISFAVRKSSKKKWDFRKKSLVRQRTSFTVGDQAIAPTGKTNHERKDLYHKRGGREIIKTGVN